jgi:flagellar biosynthesis chaperone FliJ
MSLKRIVNDYSMYNSLIEEFDERIEQQQKKLVQSKDPVDIYRAQGAILQLQNLKSLREKVNGPQKV